MNYRVATLQDVEQLTEMRWDHVEEHGHDAMQGWDEFAKICSDFYTQGIESGAWVILVAEENGVLVAHVCTQIIKKIPKPRQLYGTWGYVTNVYTKPEFRNKGIGGTLMDYMHTWAQEQKLELLLLWPSEKSVEFYKRKGFIVNSDIMQCTLNKDE